MGVVCVGLVCVCVCVCARARARAGGCLVVVLLVGRRQGGRWAGWRFMHACWMPVRLAKAALALVSARRQHAYSPEEHTRANNKPEHRVLPLRPCRKPTSGSKSSPRLPREMMMPSATCNEHTRRKPAVRQWQRLLDAAARKRIQGLMQECGSMAVTQVRQRCSGSAAWGSHGEAALTAAMLSKLCTADLRSICRREAGGARLLLGAQPQSGLHNHTHTHTTPHLGNNLGLLHSDRVQEGAGAVQVLLLVAVRQVEEINVVPGSVRGAGGGDREQDWWDRCGGCMMSCVAPQARGQGRGGHMALARRVR